jgi:acetylcholinesterase
MVLLRHPAGAAGYTSLRRRISRVNDPSLLHLTCTFNRSLEHERLSKKDGALEEGRYYGNVKCIQRTAIIRQTTRPQILHSLRTFTFTEHVLRQHYCCFSHKSTNRLSVFDMSAVRAITTLLLLCASTIAAPLTSSHQQDSLQVLTSSGTLNGFIHTSAPAVRQFLGIHYALPPTGPRRWLPAQNFTSSARISANAIGPACPQQPLRNDWVYSVNGGNMTEFFPQEIYSEDCLTLNIWTPRNLPVNASLPVIVFFFGGRFVEGATNALIYNPQSWIQRTQEHLVVTVNFRMNILGFPNAAGLTELNLGLQDQRFATEWIRDNIAAFGGDPSSMVKWGESAGAIASDYLNFARPADPIFTGMILDSGTAFFPAEGALSQDVDQLNFTSVIVAAGCNLTAAPIDCMRRVPWQTLQGMLAADTTMRFQPVVDQRIVFSNYSAQYGAGNVSSIPAMVGTNQHELSATRPQPVGSPVDSSLDLQGNYSFLCAAVESARLRRDTGLVTYRFRYDGAFPNINPAEYPGAFHAAELPMVFGTAGDFQGASTAYQDIVSKKMQDLWLGFAKDPEKGLREAGWVPDAEGGAVLLGGPEGAMVKINASELDAGCELATRLLLGDA